MPLRMEPESVRRVFEGKLISVEVESWPENKDREVVRHPGSCAVLAFTGGDDVILVRQFREAVRNELLEIPAGIMDEPGEGPDSCAARELLEETGYRITEMEPLGRFFATPGVSDESFDLFVGRAEATDASLDEHVEVVPMPFGEAVEAAHRGDLTDAKTVIALFLTQNRPGYAGRRPGLEEP